MIKKEKVTIKGLTFEFRTNTSDLHTIKHVVEQNVYKLPDDMDGMIMVDVGGHIGSACLLAASRGARVYSYEPQVDNYKMLLENIRLNGLEKKIEACNFGIGKACNRKLFINQYGNTGSHTCFLDHTEVSENVFQEIVTTPLKEEMEINMIEKCDFLKLDCEGCEKEIFAEIMGGLHERLPIIAVEIHDNKVEEYKNELTKHYSWTQVDTYEYKLCHL